MKILFISIIVLSLVIPLYLVYHNVYTQPSVDIQTFQTSKPLKMYEKQNIIITDIIRHRALIHVSSDNPFTLAYMELETNSSAKIIAFGTMNYTGVLEANAETTIVIVPLNCSAKDFKYVYRRIEFIKNYDSVKLIEYSFLPIAPLLGVLFIVSYYRKLIQKSTNINSKIESIPQQSEVNVSDSTS